MKNTILTVGDIVLQEEIYKSDFIGGKITATNTKTGEIYSKNWTKKHNGKNNRLFIMTECISALAPKEEEKEENS